MGRCGVEVGAVEVFIVLREDQNQHGFVDTGIAGVFRTRAAAEAYVQQSEGEARGEGLNVCGDESDDWDEADWEVYFKIEAHLVH